MVGDHRVRIFKPKRDTRDGKINATTCHNGTVIPAIEITGPYDLFSHRDVTDVFLIDEGQFFGPTIVDVVHDLTLFFGKDVFLFGLTSDYLGKKFGFLDEIIRLAHCVHRRLFATCSHCKRVEVACWSIRLTEESEQVVIGGKEKYEALCTECMIQERRIERQCPEIPPTKTLSRETYIL